MYLILRSCDVKIVAQAFHVQKTSHVFNPCRPIAGSVDLLKDYKVSESNAMLTRDLVSIALYVYMYIYASKQVVLCKIINIEY